MQCGIPLLLHIIQVYSLHTWYGLLFLQQLVLTCFCLLVKHIIIHLHINEHLLISFHFRHWNFCYNWVDGFSSYLFCLNIWHQVLLQCPGVLMIVPIWSPVLKTIEPYAGIQLLERYLLWCCVFPFFFLHSILIFIPVLVLIFVFNVYILFCIAHLVAILAASMSGLCYSDNIHLLMFVIDCLWIACWINWNFDVHWYPKIPGVISASSFDGKIGIYNVEVFLFLFFCV